MSLNLPKGNVPTATVSSECAKGSDSFTQPLDEFPQRPGHKECQYFLRTGKCSYKSKCKFHHPKMRAPRTPVLSPMGLPLRAGQKICPHYSHFGRCKFARACIYDHPLDYRFTALPVGCMSAPNMPCDNFVASGGCINRENGQSTKSGSRSVPVSRSLPMSEQPQSSNQRADDASDIKEFAAQEGRKYYQYKLTTQSKRTLPSDPKLAREQVEKKMSSRGVQSHSSVIAQSIIQDPEPVLAFGSRFTTPVHAVPTTSADVRDPHVVFKIPSGGGVSEDIGDCTIVQDLEVCSFLAGLF